MYHLTDMYRGRCVKNMGLDRKAGLICLYMCMTVYTETQQVFSLFDWMLKTHITQKHRITSISYEAWHHHVSTEITCYSEHCTMVT